MDGWVPRQIPVGNGEGALVGGDHLAIGHETWRLGAPNLATRGTKLGESGQTGRRKARRRTSGTGSQSSAGSRTNPIASYNRCAAVILDIEQITMSSEPELASPGEAVLDESPADAAAARGRRDRQHPELRLAVPAQLAQRRARRAERHRAQQPVRVDRHDQLGVDRPVRGIEQVLGVVGRRRVRKPSCT